MATTIDISTRLADARRVLAHYGRFDGRGLDAYQTQAANLFDALDRSETTWTYMLGLALRALVELNENAVWLDAQLGQSTAYEISQLEDRYSHLFASA